MLRRPYVNTTSKPNQKSSYFIRIGAQLDPNDNLRVLELIKTSKQVYDELFWLELRVEAVESDHSSLFDVDLPVELELWELFQYQIFFLFLPNSLFAN